MHAQVLEPLRGPTDSLERPKVREDGRRRNRRTHDPYEELTAERLVDDSTKRRDSGSATDLQSSAEYRGHAPKTAATEEVRQVGNLDSFLPRPTEKVPGRQGGRGRPGRARAKPLPDRQVVGQMQLEAARPVREQSDGDLLRDLEPSVDVAGQADPRRPARAIVRCRSDPELEDDARPDRAASPWVPRARRWCKDAGDVARGKRNGPRATSIAHG
jgi:hypothetical protein